MYKLAVIIVNYRTPDLVINTLASLDGELDEKSMKVVIVDNDSGDNSVKKISSWLNENQKTHLVNLIASDINAGFSAGNNIGIQSIESEFFMLLNSDTIVRPGCISLLLKEAEKNIKAGVISPRLEWPDTTPQESCFKYHTPMSEMISSACSGPITLLLSRYLVPQPITDEKKNYEWTSFACVLIRAEVIKELGLLDRGYFMYFEDVEFCARATQNGWLVLNVPNARVVHLRGGSSNVKSKTKLLARLPKYFYESRTRYFYQRFGQIGLLAANLFWTFGWLIANVRSVFSKRFSPKTPKYQWKDIWINFHNPLIQYTHPNDYDKT